MLRVGFKLKLSSIINVFEVLCYQTSDTAAAALKQKPQQTTITRSLTIILSLETSRRLGAAHQAVALAAFIVQLLQQEDQIISGYYDLPSAGALYKGRMSVLYFV